MNFKSLASSSAGNAYLVEDGETVLLLECGIAAKELKKRTNFKTSEIAGVLVTHEHKDHCRAIKTLLDDGIPVYASYGTAAALDEGRIKCLEERQTVLIGTISVTAFRTFHDAQEPFGFLLQSYVTGERLLFATDTCNIQYRFRDLDQIAVECNYDKEILDRSKHLPQKVKDRIQNSHFEVHSCLKFLQEVDAYFEGKGLSKCKRIFLLHLSDACSDEKKFKRVFEKEINKKYPKIEIIICEK